MNIEKAVNRIKWRIESKKWISNHNDIEALNEIVKYVNQKESKQFNDNELFAKLYIHNWIQFIDKFKSDVYDELPIKEFHKLLENPLSVFVQRFTERLNDIELENLYDNIGLSKEHPSVIPAEVKDKEMKLLTEALKDEENMKKLFRKSWDEELVLDIIKNQVNHFVNTYTNVNTYRKIK